MTDITVIIYVYNGRPVRGNRDIRILAAESEPLITLALRRNCFTDRACLRIRFLIVVPARNLRFYIRVGIGAGNFFLPIHNRVAGVRAFSHRAVTVVAAAGIVSGTESHPANV